MDSLSFEEGKFEWNDDSGRGKVGKDGKECERESGAGGVGAKDWGWTCGLASSAVGLASDDFRAKETK